MKILRYAGLMSLLAVFILWNNQVIAQTKPPLYQVGMDKAQVTAEPQFNRYQCNNLYGYNCETTMYQAENFAYVYFWNGPTTSPNAKIAHVISRAELEQKIANENTRVQTLEKEREDQQNKIKENRTKSMQELAAKKLDTVGKILNYSSGCKTEQCSSFTWVAKDASKCIYQRLAINDKNQAIYVDRTIYLNQLDPRNIKTFSGVDGQGVQYDGAVIFSSQNLDVDKLNRGWSLIYSKYCTGTTKEF